MEITYISGEDFQVQADWAQKILRDGMAQIGQHLVHRCLAVLQKRLYLLMSYLCRVRERLSQNGMELSGRIYRKETGMSTALQNFKMTYTWVAVSQVLVESTQAA